MCLSTKSSTYRQDRILGQSSGLKLSAYRVVTDIGTYNTTRPGKYNMSSKDV